MSQPVDRLLGGAALARFVDRVVKRIESGKPLTGPLTLPDASDAERSALGALVGRRPTGSVRLELLDEVVRASGAAASLRDALVALRGPIAVRADTAAADRTRWDAAFAVLDPVLRARPEYGAWAAGIRTDGLVRRLAGTPDAAAALLARVAPVLAALPVAGESRSMLAARILGDAHALDDGRPEATLILAALRPGGDRGADDRRRGWASAGVALDSLSSTVLVHRLPLPEPFAALVEHAEPVVLTLRQLRDPNLVGISPDISVFVCENPSVMEAAAATLGAGCAPLVCVGGQPSLAALALLSRLVAAGVVLRYHGDFDWGGIRIANRLHAQVGFLPWRFAAADLEAVPAPGAPLTGAPVDAVWDPALRAALQRRGSRLQEEQVVDLLLADLGCSARRG